MKEALVLPELTCFFIHAKSHYCTHMAWYLFEWNSHSTGTVCNTHRFWWSFCWQTSRNDTFPKRKGLVLQESLYLQRKSNLCSTQSPSRFTMSICTIPDYLSTPSWCFILNNLVSDLDHEVNLSWKIWQSLVPMLKEFWEIFSWQLPPFHQTWKQDIPVDSQPCHCLLSLLFYS